MPELYKFIVGNQKRTSSIKKVLINPFTNETFAEVYYAEKADIEDAIRISNEAFKKYKTFPTYRRAEILENISKIISKRKEELSWIMTHESGKPIMYSRAELDRAIFTFKYAAEEAKRIPGEVIPLDLAPNSEKRFGILRRFPIGLILAITPFNFPLNLVAHKIAPAFASGNVLILKPAPQTPLLSLILGNIMIEAGAPEGTVNILPCENELAELMVRDENFKVLTFTGSAKVGWYLKSIAGKKKVVLELGGNAAAVVDETADLDFAAERIALGAYGQAGQSCIKVQRIYIHENIYDVFLEKFLLATSKTPFGDPEKPDTVCGPLIDETSATRVKDWIDEAVKSGAKMLYGGKRNGLLITPTVLTNVTPEMNIFKEEIFGPVVTLHKFRDIFEAVAGVNNSRYGLQAGIFSNSFKNIMYAFENLEVGGVIANDFPTYRIDHMPYGGIKDSGIGREGLKYAIQEITEPRMLIINQL